MLFLLATVLSISFVAKNKASMVEKQSEKSEGEK